jgi:hypothetical protein
MNQRLGEKDAGPATESGQMFHLQEMGSKTFLSEGLSVSGGALKKLFTSTSTYTPEPTEQSEKIFVQAFLPIELTFSFLSTLKVV